MFRIALIILIGLVISFLFLKGRVVGDTQEKPIFLRVDTIANEHQTTIDVVFRSAYRGTPDKMETLTNDYANLWAHLNHLHATNDVEAGKEYYTEGWFRHICNHYAGVQKPIVLRSDEQHKLIIQNWARDELVCTAIDSNLVFRYQYPDSSVVRTKANVALVLLFQGDHWRIDAMNVLNESVIDTTK